MPKPPSRGKPASRVRTGSKLLTKQAKASRARKTAGNKIDRALRRHLLDLLRGGGAHVNFEKAVADLPAELRGAQPRRLEFTVWRLLEHIRIAQRDIVEFSKNPHHVSPEWPSGYWPSADAPPSDADWDNSVEAVRKGLKEMERMVSSSSGDLFARIPHGSGQTLLREALLIVDHNAYHIGQIVMLRRLLGAWPKGGFTA